MILNFQKKINLIMRPQLFSWLKDLDNLFPEELPFGTFRVGRSCFRAMAVTENYQSTPHTPHRILIGTWLIVWFRGSWKVSVLCHLCLFYTLQALWRGKKTITYLHIHIFSLWTWLELDRKNNVQRAIRVSNTQNVFSAQTGDCHILPIYDLSTLHHAHPRRKTAIGLCIVPSEVDAVPIHSLTNQPISHQSSPQWISTNKKFHSKAREGENGSAWRCFVHHLSWQSRPRLGRSLFLWWAL